MHNPDLYPDQIRQNLVALYQQRLWGLTDYSARTRLYGDAFTDVLAKQGYLDSQLSLSDLFWLPRCIALHNLGVIAEPDSRADVVNKGLLLLKRVEQVWGHRPFSRCLTDVVGGYYERCDGTGMPHGLRATNIPLAARIASIVGCYAQWCASSNVSKQNLHGQAMRRLADAAGSRFDPELVLLFQGLSQALLIINERFEEPFASVYEACA